ncbi:MAG: PhnD/SsuA/transferrin family substrate-binding protein [Polyangiaceae bacterium]|nr:PhnD/SsuA/transferrin family substrate-binding protein [Polyangiaceae bacterium]
MNRRQRASNERTSRIEPLTRLATGGMADIWLSREIGAAGMERFVVVKRLLPHLAREPEIVNMFVSEARFVARLTHPNVVQIHDLGEDDEGYYLVMEYVAGCSVSELLTAAAQSTFPLPFAASLCIAEQACHGAHAAHELCDPTGKPLGLVHRDISPHNLMIGPSGEVKLLDFGIAKATAAAEATRTGSLKGKHGYMSPEQCSATHVDRRSDIFALGIVTWELLTGARLFKRETEYATMHAIVNGDIRPATSVRPDLPIEIDTVLAKALAIDLNERWQTADAFRRALISAAEKNGIRSSRDTLGAVMGDLLGNRLKERERALQEAAKSDRPVEPHVLRAALIHSDTSAPGSLERTPDAAATVVQRRAPIHTEEPESDIPSSPALQQAAPPPDRDATVVDARPVVSPGVQSASSSPSTPAQSGQSASTGDESQPTQTLPTQTPPAAVVDTPPAGSKRRLWIAAAIGLVATVGVGLVIKVQTAPTPNVPSDSNQSTRQIPSGPPLRFVVAPTVDPAVLKNELAPFLLWLGRTLSRPTELLIADSYDHTAEMVAHGRGDFALMPPLLFVRAFRREPGLQPLAVRLFDGSRASDGYLLIRDDSQITQAADLKGHRICYVDKASTTGFLLPRIWMRKANVVPDKDVQSIVSGDHIAAMRDLAAGKCDAAAVYSGAFLTARQEGIPVGRLRVLAITGRVPQDAVVASPSMPSDEMHALRSALLGFEPKRDIDAGRIGEVLGITGFAPFQTAEFNSIREAAESEGLLAPPAGTTR